MPRLMLQLHQRDDMMETRETAVFHNWTSYFWPRQLLSKPRASVLLFIMSEASPRYAFRTLGL